MRKNFSSGLLFARFFGNIFSSPGVREYTLSFWADLNVLDTVLPALAASTRSTMLTKVPLRACVTR